MSYLGPKTSNLDPVINYISNGRAYDSTIGWSTYADLAGIQPVDGTGGSPTITWTRNTTSALRQGADFRLVKDNADRQGEGVAYDITVDNADLAKVLTVTFDYEVVSGTYATGDLTVYLIQDPTGTPVVIQPVGYQVQAGSVGTKLKQIATFQTASNVNDYRLCFHVASTSTSAYTLAIDNVMVGLLPSTADGRVIAASASRGSVAVTAFQPINYSTIKYDTHSAITTGSSWKFTAPVSGVYSVSIAGITKSPNGNSVYLYKNGVQYNVLLAFQVAGYVDSCAIDVKCDAGDYLDIRCDGSVTINAGLLSIHCVSSTSISGSSEVIATKIRRSSGQTISGSTPTIIQFNVSEFDTLGSFNTSTYTYTVPVAGVYEISGQYLYGGIPAAAGYDAHVRLFVNGLDSDIQGTANTGTVSQAMPQRFLFLKKLNAGDTIAIRAWHNVGSGLVLLGDSTVLGASTLHITRLSNSSAIAASETVAASYYATGNRTPSTIKAVNYDFKVFDTHGAVTTVVGDIAGWKFTAPIQGKYAVTISSFQSVGLGGGSLNIYKNGTANKNYLVPATLANHVLNGSAVLELNAGDYLDIRSDATPTLSNVTAEILKVYIHRIGN